MPRKRPSKDWRDRMEDLSRAVTAELERRLKDMTPLELTALAKGIASEITAARHLAPGDDYPGDDTR